jgi:hypothetical protein
MWVRMVDSRNAHVILVVKTLGKRSLGMKMTVFWDAAPCNLVEVYRRFRGACCLHHQGLPLPVCHLSWCLIKHKDNFVFSISRLGDTDSVRLLISMPSQVRGSTWQHGCGPEGTMRERERGTHYPTLSVPLPLVHTRSLCPTYTQGAVKLKAPCHLQYLRHQGVTHGCTVGVQHPLSWTVKTAHQALSSYLLCVTLTQTGKSFNSTAESYGFFTIFGI